MIALRRRLDPHRSFKTCIVYAAGMFSAAFMAVGEPTQAFASESAAVRAVEEFSESITEFLENHADAADSVSAGPDGLSNGLFRILDEHLDIEAISQTVLGTAWRRASENQRLEFQNAFTSYLAQKYLQYFPGFVGAEFKIVGSDERRENHFVVYSDATIGDRTTRVEWYVLHRRGKNRIVNIASKDTSILSVERRVIRSLLQQRSGNLDRLTLYLPNRHAGT